MQEVFEKITEKFQSKIESLGGASGSNEIQDVAVKEIMWCKEIVKQSAAEHNNVIIDGEYCWQSCWCTEKCGECIRLCNGDIDFYESYDERHNNGWIPCGKELPPQPEVNPIFENKPLELYLVSVKGADYPIRAFWNGKFFTDGWSKLDAVAWQPLPEPYQSEGE